MMDAILPLTTTPPAVWILMTILLITGSVFAIMLYSIVQHHKTHPTPRFHSKMMVEIGWTAVPLLILVVSAYPALKLLVTPQPLAIITQPSAH